MSPNCLTYLNNFAHLNKVFNGPFYFDLDRQSGNKIVDRVTGHFLL